MPSHRAASCAQTWQPSTYVCLSCRHQLLARQSPQRRSRSNFSSHDEWYGDGEATSTRLSSRRARSIIDTRPLRTSAASRRFISLASGLGDEDSRGTPRRAIGGSAAGAFKGVRTLTQDIAENGMADKGPHEIGLETESKNDKSSDTLIHYHFSNSKSIQATTENATKNTAGHGKTASAAFNAAEQIGKGITTSARAGTMEDARRAWLASRTPASEEEFTVPILSETSQGSEVGSPAPKNVRKVSTTRSSKNVRAKTAGSNTDVAKEKGGGRKKRRRGGGARKSTSTASKAVSTARSSKVGDKNHSDTPESVEHKPLWEVMADLESSRKDVPTQSSTAKAKSRPSKQVEVHAAQPKTTSADWDQSTTVQLSQLEITPLDLPQPSVPGLEYGLDRVLFNPGVYQLQDPLSRVYNFDPYLQKIMPVKEFDFNALKEYKTSSQDTVLATLAQTHGKRYIGSTSSMTSTLAHFHFLLSAWRPVNLGMLSRGFSDKLDTFTAINRAPNAMFLRWKNGTYAMDADKEYDSGNVLMLLGKSMEKLLTMPTVEYERYRKSDPREVTEEERVSPEAYQFTTMGDFLMRSQLDAHDPRLPGTGMFDLKTRAVVSVRMDSKDFEPMTGYEIQTLQGRYGSYEREYYDMIRSTMLKYMLQVRMGRMDGIFVAYHNVERIFGFQYLPLQELDRALHGQVNSCLGDQEFKMSLELLNKVLDRATAKFPEQSLRFHIETSSANGSETPAMWIFAEPMNDEDIDKIQNASRGRIEDFEKTMMGFEKEENAGPCSTENNSSSTEAVRSSDNVTPAQAIEATSSGSSAAGSASPYVSSDSDADPEFMKSITSTPAKTPKAPQPLFAASLVCRSRINGVNHTRPPTLRPWDEWQVDYLIREWDASDAIWARYEQMKFTRKQAFEKEDEDDAYVENGKSTEMSSRQKRESHFIEFLRSMSNSGRDFRSKMDELEAGKPAVVVG